MKGNLKKRGNSYMKADTASQKKHGLTRTQQMVFPGKEKIPLFARLGLLILRRYNARVVDALKDNEGAVK